MKIQRILTATIRNDDTAEVYFQIVLAFTERREFVVWDYQDHRNYFTGHYFKTFAEAYKDFNKRYVIHPGLTYKSIEYSARQIGQAEIIWEEL